MGKATKVYTNKQIIEVYIKCNFNKVKLAEALDLGYSMLNKRITTDPKLKAMFEEAEEMRIDMAEGVLNELVQFRDVKAVKFFLERKARKRGYGQKIEIDKGEGDRKFSTVKIVDGDKIIELC